MDHRNPMNTLTRKKASNGFSKLPNKDFRQQWLPQLIVIIVGAALKKMIRKRVNGLKKLSIPAMRMQLMTLNMLCNGSTVTLIME